MRFFNTSGPVNEKDHYCLPLLSRLNLKEILTLIDNNRYFVLHAPRQTGKTSFLLSLMNYLNKSGEYHSLYINVEVGQSARENIEMAMKDILIELVQNAEDYLNDNFPREQLSAILHKEGVNLSLNSILTQWSKHSQKPIVLLIDEIDSLIGDTLIAVLRQLRAGYTKRPDLFPQSIILCGVRDVRDYRIHSDKQKTIITGGSAFNIKEKSLRLSDFSKEDVIELYQQHTKETGQTFGQGVFDRIWELTNGQPWLVNALGREACFEIADGKNRSKEITFDLIEQAKENLILRRDTHLDQLADKLEEERVRRVIEPILTGKNQPQKLSVDDIQYVEDLGLIKTKGNLMIANKIYQEVIPRELTYSTQLTISNEPDWYVKTDDGCLDIEKLLSSFQDFFRENSEDWIRQFDYKEAGPQLLLQAFLQRIVIGGGRVEREYGLGYLRTDLLVIWQGKIRLQKIVLELKILYGSLKTTIDKGKEQIFKYMDHCGAEEGHLLIFNKVKNRAWSKKIFRKSIKYNGITIKIWGM